MSFGQQPPRTAYGDQDFIKEDIIDSSQQTSAPSQPPPVAARYNQNVPYSTLAPPQPSPYNLQPGQLGGQRQQPGQVDITNLVQSLTPEDQIFMQSWRRDSFVYRVLPLSIISSGALYFYNQTKNLPNKTSRYLLISFGAYIVGKWSYKDELKRRLETNPSNTPFMKAMRDMLGVRSPFSELAPEFSGDGSQDYGGFGSSNEARANLSSGYARAPPNPQGQTSNYSAYEPDLSLSPPPQDTTDKTMTSYEELRARNRGLIQK